MKIKSAEELAKALTEHGWVSSKTTEKTIAVMIGMNNIPWDKVKLFSLRWESVGVIVTVINIMMHSDVEKDKDMVEVALESLMDMDKEDKEE